MLFSESSEKEMLLSSILIHLLNHRVCDAIREGRTGGEVRFKHQF